MMTGARVFVAGGGFVGSAIVSALLDAGYAVRLLARRPQRMPQRDGLEVVGGDALADGAWKEALRGCVAAINCIGIIRERRRSGISFERVHIEANAALLAAAQAAGVPRFILISAHGARPDGVSRYQTTKFAAEEALRSSGLNWTIFRPSLVIGPGIGFFSQISPIVRFMPLAPVFGNGLYRFEPVDRRVLAAAIAAALDHPAASGKYYEFHGDRSWTYLELLDAVGAAWGRKHVRKVHIPLGFVRLMLTLFGWLPFAPLTRDQLEMLVEADIGNGPDAAVELALDWIPLPEALQYAVACTRKEP